LPVPVAIFSATRGSPSLCSALILARSFPIQTSPVPRSGLGQIDRRLSGLALGEQDAVVAFAVGPVFEESSRRRGDTVVAARPPDVHPGPDRVDLLVDLDLVGRQLGDLELCSALARSGNGDEVRGRPAPVVDLVGDPVGVETEMAGRLVVRPVDDRVRDDEIAHGPDASGLAGQMCGAPWHTRPRHERIAR